MATENEQSFLEVFTAALVALPFDLKVLVDVIAEADLDAAAQEQAAAAFIHILSPKDGHYEPFLRHAEDVVLLRLALKHVADGGGDGVAHLRARFPDSFGNLETELGLMREALGVRVVDWLDSRWPSLKKAVYAKKTAVKLVQDESLVPFLYDVADEFATNYSITESIGSRVKQVQPIREHLERKLEQDKMRISH
jgi:hypothetical protein